jgi:hypothetical protein
MRSDNCSAAAAGAVFASPLQANPQTPLSLWHFDHGRCMSQRCVAHCRCGSTFWRLPFYSDECQRQCLQRQPSHRPASGARPFFCDVGRNSSPFRSSAVCSSQRVATLLKQRCPCEHFLANLVSINCHFLGISDSDSPSPRRLARDCPLHTIEIGSVAWSESISALSQPLQLAPTSSDDLVTLQFTSGSTGSAKAVPVTDRMQNHRFMSGFSLEHVAFAFQPPVSSHHPSTMQAVHPRPETFLLGVLHSEMQFLSHHFWRWKTCPSQRRYVNFLARGISRRSHCFRSTTNNIFIYAFFVRATRIVDRARGRG